MCVSENVCMAVKVTEWVSLKDSAELSLLLWIGQIYAHLIMYSLSLGLHSKGNIKSRRAHDVDTKWSPHHQEP